MNLITRSLMACAAILFLSASAYSTDFYVSASGGDTHDASLSDGLCKDAAGKCTLRAAIDQSNALGGGNRAFLQPGVYTQTLAGSNEDFNAGGDWDIRSSLDIEGSGQTNTFIQADVTPGTATERVFDCPLTTTNVIINAVTIRYGRKTGTSSTATRGGGIHNAGELWLQGSTITQNTASGAGGISNEGEIRLEYDIVSENSCFQPGTSCFGGGMYNVVSPDKHVTINNTTFDHNSSNITSFAGTAHAAGMGVEGLGSFYLSIDSSSFTNNNGVGVGTGGSDGNGIRVVATNGQAHLSISRSKISSNYGNSGATIQGSGMMLISGGPIGSIVGTVSETAINANKGNARGAGVYLMSYGYPSNISFYRSTISRNQGSNGGGLAAANVSGSGTLSSVSVSLTNSTVSFNSASNYGGGVFLEQSGPAAVTVYSTNSTIARNDAAVYGGGFYHVSGTVYLQNSVIADNSAPSSGPDLSGVFNSQDYNLIGLPIGYTMTGTTTHNYAGAPLLGFLQNNGGLTETQLPQAGSPIINSIPIGVNGCGSTLTIDQRGVVRPTGGACDKGSVEQ